jgi:queuine/archaeosine tRNA-ribosyltransferase
MANARQQKQPKALIRRTLESARREIEQIERKFHRTIKAVQNGGFTSGRRSRKAATARTRTAAGSAMGRPAPVQTAITNVLKKRGTGLTMDRLQAALPKFDEKSLLNATFAMRRKGLITFEKNGKGRGKYRWQD